MKLCEYIAPWVIPSISPFLLYDDLHTIDSNFLRALISEYSTQTMQVHFIAYDLRFILYDLYLMYWKRIQDMEF